MHYVFMSGVIVCVYVCNFFSSAFFCLFPTIANKMRFTTAVKAVSFPMFLCYYFSSAFDSYELI